ncbi:acyl-CoA dehydrogenase family protein [Actinosynnema pretiosum]|uniref:Acyl-CoA dehydrogenase/oxidase C-terminal domain-containing protein n=1 Tax=Actinosynnema pretiosum TaxID=42197 RepID=A0A290Z6N3_9PSEU|nr:acyl-CoA dehydrogenase family protein [Actinosynnema pretiosum]ATE54711.1 hypothetical protein CNX65_16675 [Actinosynnema pretiosum]
MKIDDHAPTAPGRERIAAELERLGLLHADRGVEISRFAVFVPCDELGVARPVVLHAGARVGPFAVVHGGAVIGAGARVEERAVLGRPELGCAFGRERTGTGGNALLDAGAVLRAGAIAYAGVRVGAETVVGHHTLLRTGVRVGAGTQLGHALTVERGTRIGSGVRCSPGSHLTGECVLADRVFLGAGVRTINDKTLTWRHPEREPELRPPVFDTGARVGTRTVARPGPAGTWLVSGRKTWISRLTEARVFAVLLRVPDGRLRVAAVDAAEPGLRRLPLPPAGLAGWSWGVLELDRVPLRPAQLLDGDGTSLLRAHFAAYRPLVTATALGAAAAVLDTTAAHLVDRRARGEVPRLRDTALHALGRAHARLCSALLATANAALLAEGGDPDAESWGAATKAHGVDTAVEVVAELVPLLGAAGVRADGQVAKTRRDLEGLRCADGVHDSLYLAAGTRRTTG